MNRDSCVLLCMMCGDQLCLCCRPLQPVQWQPSLCCLLSWLPFGSAFWGRHLELCLPVSAALVQAADDTCEAQLELVYTSRIEQCLQGNDPV